LVQIEVPTFRSYPPDVLYRRDGRGGIREALLVAVAAIVLVGCVAGETGDARYVADEAATLQGVLLSTQTGPARYWFEYGKTTRYGAMTPHLTAEVVAGERRPVSVRVDGLHPTTTYHYRLCGLDDDADPQGLCGPDRTFSTGTGRESVTGDGNAVIDADHGAHASVTAAADPGGAGYLDGVAEFTQWFRGPPPNFGRFTFGGGGAASCLRVEGNLAVIGFSFTDPIAGTHDAALVIRDNGPTGDGFGVVIDPAERCLQPDASLIQFGLTSGDFQVDDD
jgi:hypothetical protein